MEMMNRVDGGSCPQSPAALRRGDSGGTAPRFAWPLRGKGHKKLSERFIFKEHPPRWHARKKLERLACSQAQRSRLALNG